MGRAHLGSVCTLFVSGCEYDNDDGDTLVYALLAVFFQRATLPRSAYRPGALAPLVVVYFSVHERVMG